MYRLETLDKYVQQYYSSEVELSVQPKMKLENFQMHNALVHYQKIICEFLGIKWIQRKGGETSCE